MRNYLIGLLLGIGLTVLVFTLKIGCNAPKKTNFTLFERPEKIEPKSVGDGLISAYQNLPDAKKLFATTVKFIFINSDGFKQLVNNPLFYGFKIYLGYDSATNSYSLLFSALDSTKKEYFYADPAAPGEYYYLNKTTLCPDPSNPNCP